jgi:hypothetical protein
MVHEICGIENNRVDLRKTGGKASVAAYFSGNCPYNSLDTGAASERRGDCAKL